MADELLNEMQIICTQGAIEESGEKIERLKAACHTKLPETERNCDAHFAEKGMPFSQSAVPS